MSRRIDEENWKSAVIKAINTLPEDLRESVGYIDESDCSMKIIVAGEPIGSRERDQTQTHLSPVLIRYRKSIWDHGRMVTEEEAMNERVDFRPVVSVSTVGTLDEFHEEYEIGYDSVKLFKSGVRRAILEALWSGGGTSLVQKDTNGRFVRRGGLTALRFRVADDDFHENIE